MLGNSGGSVFNREQSVYLLQECGERFPARGVKISHRRDVRLGRNQGITRHNRADTAHRQTSRGLRKDQTLVWAAEKAVGDHPPSEHDTFRSAPAFQATAIYHVRTGRRQNAEPSVEPAGQIGGIVAYRNFDSPAAVRATSRAHLQRRQQLSCRQPRWCAFLADTGAENAKQLARDHQRAAGGHRDRAAAVGPAEGYRGLDNVVRKTITPSGYLTG